MAISTTHLSPAVPPSDDPATLSSAALTPSGGSASETTLRTPLIPGYRLLRRVGRGGQGLVYEALQESTRRNVAIKLLREREMPDADAVRRFRREVQIVAQLRHPNIAAVFDSGLTVAGDPYCVMEFVRGRPLDSFVREQRLDVPRVLALFEKVCRAVAFAHHRGVVHRDLKPGNVLVDEAGEPFVLDFGLARAERADDRSLTRSDQIMGSLPYLSPEQARGAASEVDARSDVYALGVTLYRLLTGAFPYPVDGSLHATLSHILRSEPREPRRAWTSDAGAVNPRSRANCPIGHDLAVILLKALSKAPERRYPSAAPLADDLARCAAGRPIEARADGWAYGVAKRAWRLRTRIGLAAGFAVALGAAGYFYWQTNELRTAQLDALARFQESGDPNEATRLLEMVLARDPSRLDARLRLARMCKLAGNRTRALAECEALRNDAPQSVEAVGAMVLAATLLTEGDPRKDRYLAEARRRAGEGDDWTRAMLAEDPKAALEIADRLVAEDPKSLDARWLRVNALFELGEYERVLEESRFLTQAVPRLAGAWLYQGSAHGQLGERARRAGQDADSELREAEASFSRAIELAPDEVAGYRNRAAVRYRRGDVQGVLADSSHVLQYRSEDVMTLELRAWALAKSQRMRDALRAADRAVELDPGRASARMTRAKMLLELGRTDEALDELCRLIAADPGSDWAERARQTLNAEGLICPL